MPTRRSLLRSTFLLTAGSAVPPLLRGLQQTSPEQSAPPPNNAATVIATRSTAAPSSLPANFIGLGYEMSSAAEIKLLAATDRPYVQLVRNLGAHGVLRMGGIVADYSRYEPQGTPRSLPKDTVVTQASLVQLRSFLDATGWTAIWSVNFGKRSLTEAVTEASAVHQILGPKLYAIELGNEVENYGKGSSPSRPPSYDYPQYLAEFRRWHRSLSAATPGLRFAAPDTAASVEWVQQMAADAHGDVQLLTTHYYRGDQHHGTLDQLTQPDPALADKLAKLRSASQQSHIPWRMCETNSFFGGGRPGLSDTFAASLWTLNYLLLLAQSGCSGVNLETGVNQLGFMSSYSPIKADGKGDVKVGPSYYGLLAFATAAKDADEIFPIDLHPSSTDLLAYGLARHGRIQSAVILNWSPDHSRSISLEALGMRSARLLLLTAPSLTSDSGLKLADAPVASDGTWSPQVQPVANASPILVPPSTAAILRA